MNIHLVEPLNHFVKLKDNVWESGSWGLDEDKAKKLVGGEIYFHKKRQEPSFYGGTILGYRVHQMASIRERLSSSSNIASHAEMSARINPDGARI